MPQFIVMFRSRFNDAFPRGAPHVGPQDIEQGVAEGAPSADVEGLLCALLGLVLNRKKPVESVLRQFPLFIMRPGSHNFGECLKRTTANVAGVSQEGSLWPRARRINPDPKVAVATRLGRCQPFEWWSRFPDDDGGGTCTYRCSVLLSELMLPRSPSSTP